MVVDFTPKGGPILSAWYDDDTGAICFDDGNCWTAVNDLSAEPNVACSPVPNFFPITLNYFNPNTPEGWRVVSASEDGLMTINGQDDDE